MRPAAILHSLAGSPEMAGCDDAPATCVVCGAHHERTARYDAWQGATFTDQNKLRGHGMSDRVCEPCVWSHAWVPPPGWEPDAESTERKRAAKRAAGKKVDESKERPPNLRLFWHAWDEGGYVFGTKGDKPVLRAWLERERVGRWFLAVPDTGQKHVLPWTPTNLSPRGRRVRFESSDVALGDVSTIDAICEALTAGVTKDEIEAQRYTQRSWSIAEDHVRRMQRLGAESECGWWSLAVWLSQRDEARAAERMKAEKEVANGRRAARGERAGRGGGVRARDSERVPGGRRRRADTLGPDREQVREGVPHDVDDRGVGDDGASRAEAGREQLTLF